MRHTALVAGASGLIGRRIAEHLAATGWEVIRLGRRPPQEPGWIGVDLADAADCRSRLAGLRRATHVFYAARFDHPEGQPESVEVNAAMLRNLIEALDPVAALEHVHAVHGSKYYGHQFGPVPVPLTEDSPRAAGANFYFDQQDFLGERSSRGGWSYTISRPHVFCDRAIDNPRSIGLVIAAFAEVQRELGLPLDFPGSTAAFAVRTQFTDLGLLARAVTWMATDARCANQAFNVVNGDSPTWSGLWPGIARCFRLEPGVPRAFDLAGYMADKGEIWDRVVRKHGLRPTRLDEIALWPYGNYAIQREWDIVSSMDKARALGFRDVVDSADMFARQFEHYRAERVIP